MSDKGLIYSSDLYEFAQQIVWFDGPERRVTDIFAFLAFVMAKSPRSAYNHARLNFGFSDKDFQEALRQAKPGLFMHREQWEMWNKELSIEPPLPMPERIWNT